MHKYCGDMDWLLAFEIALLCNESYDFRCIHVRIQQRSSLNEVSISMHKYLELWICFLQIKVALICNESNINGNEI